MTGIIGAMDIEIESIKKSVVNPAVTMAAGIEFICGKIENKEVCVARCNPGKVNAALCTQLMIDRFGVQRVINIGVGCSLRSDIVIKNVVVASEVCQYDIDTNSLGDPKGYISGLNIVKIAADSELSSALAESAKACGETVHSGCIASGDTFISSTALKSEIAAEFGAVCGEMEGAAVGHVCYANGVPFAVLRTISDGGDESAQLDYPIFKTVAADISSRIIIDYLKK